ncbi:SecDF P1 head subdomain-containing protein [Longispora urticae]
MEPEPPWSATAPARPASGLAPGVIVLVVLASVVVLGLLVTVGLVFSGVLGADEAPAPSRGGIARPVSLLPVEEEYAEPCRTGDQPAGKDDPGKCHHLGAGMVITAVEEIGVRIRDARNVIYLGLSAEDARRFGDLTTKVAAEAPPRNRIAIVVDGQVLSTPNVATPITGGQIEISGTYTAKEARDLVARIKG